MLANLGEEKDTNCYSSVEYMHPSHILCGCVAEWMLRIRVAKVLRTARMTHSSGGRVGLQKRVPSVECLLEPGDHM